MVDARRAQEQPQSTVKVAPIRHWGVGVHWTGAVLLWGSKPNQIARVKIEKDRPLAVFSTDRANPSAARPESPALGLSAKA